MRSHNGIGTAEQLTICILGFLHVSDLFKMQLFSLLLIRIAPLVLRSMIIEKKTSIDKENLAYGLWFDLFTRWNEVALSSYNKTY